MLIALVPEEESLAAHREYYGARKAVAPAKVRNAQALVALGEPRALRFRGHGYTVPPIHFAAGAKLLVVQQALEASPQDARALMLARRILHTIVRTKRGRRPWRNPFRRIDAPTAIAVIGDLLHVPDESPSTSGSAADQTIDLMDGLLEFVRMFPAWVGPDGLPVGWAMYQYGLRHIGRTFARDTLRAASAARVAQADKADFQSFTREQRSAAGWN